MNRYYVRIDGQESPDSYSYEELKEMGVLDFDDIGIRKTNESTWCTAKYYIFPEIQSATGYSVDDYGQIVVKDTSATTDYTVDQYGQLVRHGDPNSSSLSNTTTSTSSSTTSSSYSSGSNTYGGGIEWGKILLSIGVVGLVIGLSAASIGIGTPLLAYGGYRALKEIWDW
jgi:hypothetical protein